jgi:hypothetical protein
MKYISLEGLYLSLIVIFLLVGCGSNPTNDSNKKNVDNVTKVLGEYEDKIIRVDAVATLNTEKDMFVVESTINNKSNHMVQLLVDCNDLVSYEGEPEQSCNDAYSMTLEAGKRFNEEVEIPKNLFLSKDTFDLEIIYIPIVGKKSVVVVPFKMENNDENLR